MKNRFLSTLASLFLLALITFSSSCAITVAEKNHPPRHKNRTVWVNGVRYKQVYYVDNITQNVIIVNQTEVPKKPPKHNKNHGKHKGH